MLTALNFRPGSVTAGRSTQLQRHVATFTVAAAPRRLHMKPQTAATILPTPTATVPVLHRRRCIAGASAVVKASQAPASNIVMLSSAALSPLSGSLDSIDGADTLELETCLLLSCTELSTLSADTAMLPAGADFFFGANAEPTRTRGPQPAAADCHITADDIAAAQAVLHAKQAAAAAALSLKNFAVQSRRNARVRLGEVLQLQKAELPMAHDDGMMPGACPEGANDGMTGAEAYWWEAFEDADGALHYMCDRYAAAAAEAAAACKHYWAVSAAAAAATKLAAAAAAATGDLQPEGAAVTA